MIKVLYFIYPTFQKFNSPVISIQEFCMAENSLSQIFHQHRKQSFNEYVLWLCFYYVKMKTRLFKKI